MLKKALKTVTRRLYEVEFKFPPPKDAHKFDGIKYEGMGYEEVWEKRQKYLSPSVSTFEAFEDRPFYNTRARMQYMYDEEGRPYLDLLAQNQTISCGHNHPKVLAKMQEQIDNLVHSTTMYYNDASVSTAEKLVNKLPPGEDWVVHFVNSGAEAIDLAILLARQYTGVYDFLAIRNAYHGLVISAMGLTCLSTCKQTMPHGFGVKHVQRPDDYRGLWQYDDPDAGIKYAEDVRDTIFYETSGYVSGMIFEPIQGYGGAAILPKGYFERSAEYVREAGGLIIADEIQTGFGRTGSHYWGFELHGITPDIITFAKGFGNGLPLAAIAAKREICESMANKAYFNTYGGNPTITRIGGAVIDTIDEEGLQENARIVGEEFKKGFAELKSKYSIIGDCRGTGLMQGVEIVSDYENKTPSRDLCREVFEILRDNGIVPGKGGTYGNVFRINPPLCTTVEDVKWTCDVLGYACGRVMDAHNM